MMGPPKIAGSLPTYKYQIVKPEGSQAGEPARKTVFVVKTGGTTETDTSLLSIDGPTDGGSISRERPLYSCANPECDERYFSHMNYSALQIKWKL